MQPHKKPMQIVFDTLYYLDSKEISILEIKRLDQPAGSTVDQIFHWLLFNKETKQIQHLTFRSLDSSSVLEERFFVEGFLKFSETEGTYIQKFNSGQFEVKNRSTEPLPEVIKEAVQRYFNPA